MDRHISKKLEHALGFARALHAPTAAMELKFHAATRFWLLLAAHRLTSRNSFTLYFPVGDLAGSPSLSLGEMSSHRYSPRLRLFCSVQHAGTSWCHTDCWQPGVIQTQQAHLVTLVQQKNWTAGLCMSCQVTTCLLMNNHGHRFRIAIRNNCQQQLHVALVLTSPPLLP